MDPWSLTDVARSRDFTSNKRRKGCRSYGVTALLRAAMSETDASEYLSQAIARMSARPRWMPGAQELFWKGRVVRRFRYDADNQALLLAAFEAAGWPGRIEDPLRRGPASQHR